MDFREIVLSDLHAPYHDPYAVELACRVIEVAKPTRVIIDGDLLDFYTLSKFDKDPARVQDNLQNELDVADAILTDIVSACNKSCEIELLPGNHEDRLYRYLCRHPELASLRVLELPTLLQLDKHGITYHAHEYLMLSTLVVKHGDRVRKHSAYTARAELENEMYSISVITGHTHRLGAHYATTRRGPVVAYENGCLCDMTPEYVHSPNWQQGFTIVQHSGRDSFFAEQVVILGDGANKRTLVMGQEVR